MNLSEDKVVLTPRENEVVRLLVMGLSRKEIASQLGITYSTLDSHFKHIFLKLNVRSMVETAIWAVKTKHLQEC